MTAENSLEWVYLPSGEVSSPLIELNGKEYHGLELKVNRTYGMNLTASITGCMKSEDYDSLKKELTPEPDSFPEGFIIKASRNQVDILEVQEALVTTWNCKLNLRDGSASVDLSIRCNSVNRFFKHHDAATTMLTDWYIGGPRSTSQLWTRVTSREFSEQFARIRHDQSTTSIVPDVRFPPPGLPPSESTSRDFLLLDIPSYGPIIVAEVPSAYTPEWTTGIAIEFHEDESNGIPDTTTRTAISEILGYLLGKQLLYVGATKFDSLGQTTMQTAYPIWDEGVISICRRLKRPPIPIYPFDPMKEAVISKLIDSFLEKRATLSLQETLWIMWEAEGMPVGFDLPLYGAALEGLMKSWFKSIHSKSKGIYMKTPEFKSIIKDGVDKITISLGEHKYADRILRKIKNCNQMGPNERFEHFFRELDLLISENELTAIKARNYCAHGHIVLPEKLREFVDLSTTYRVLLNRVILRLLDYKGEISDYEPHLSEPVNCPTDG